MNDKYEVEVKSRGNLVASNPMHFIYAFETLL